MLPTNYVFLKACLVRKQPAKITPTMGKKKKKTRENQIATNSKARHDYFIEEYFEAGLVLEGWEVKSLRAGRVHLKDAYVLIKKGEGWLIGAHITPMNNVPEHIHADPIRTRKLLLHHRELKKLKVAREREGYTVVALDLHWRHHCIKVEIGTAKGKKTHDKRETSKRRDWEREKARFLKR